MSNDELRTRIGQGFADHGIPPSLHRGIVLYCLDRLKTAGFLQACFENDFARASDKADRQNAPRLAAIGIFISTCTPEACHGSPEKVAAWLAGDQVTREAPLIADVATVAEGGPGAPDPAAPTTRGNLPPDTEDVEGPRHPGGEEVDA